MLVINRRPNFHHVGDELHFMPGSNEVDEKKWAEALKLPAFKALVDEGVFEVVETAQGKPVNAADFGKLAEKDAIALVAETMDRKMLEGWAADEKRKAVSAAIAAQLALVDPTNGKGKKE